MFAFRGSENNVRTYTGCKEGRGLILGGDSTPNLNKIGQYDQGRLSPVLEVHLSFHFY